MQIQRMLPEMVEAARTVPSSQFELMKATDAVLPENVVAGWRDPTGADWHIWTWYRKVWLAGMQYTDWRDAEIARKVYIVSNLARAGGEPAWWAENWELLPERIRKDWTRQARHFDT